MKKLFSLQVIKQSLKKTWIWWLIGCVVVSANLVVFSTEKTDGIALLARFAEGGLSANGVIFITVLSILFANLLITSEIDRGTLSVALNTPTMRKQILFSKMLVFVLFQTSICIIVGIVGTLSVKLYGIDIDLTKWWTIVSLWLLYSFLIGGIAFAIGCWFNKSIYTLATAAIVLGAFFLLNMLAQSESVTFFKYFTLQTLFDMKAVLDGNSVLWQMLVMPVLAVPFYAAGAVKFLKKDLPL